MQFKMVKTYTRLDQILKFINDSQLASGRNITNYNTMNEHDTERRVTNQNKLGGLQMSYIGLNNHWT